MPSNAQLSVHFGRLRRGTQHRAPHARQCAREPVHGAAPHDRRDPLQGAHSGSLCSRHNINARPPIRMRPRRVRHALPAHVWAHLLARHTAGDGALNERAALRRNPPVPAYDGWWLDAQHSGYRRRASESGNQFVHSSHYKLSPSVVNKNN